MAFEDFKRSLGIETFEQRKSLREIDLEVRQTLAATADEDMYEEKTQSKNR